MPEFKPAADLPGEFTIEQTSYDWWRGSWVYENSNYTFVSPKRERALEIVEAHAKQISEYLKAHP